MLDNRSLNPTASMGGDNQSQRDPFGTRETHEAKEITCNAVT